MQYFYLSDYVSGDRTFELHNEDVRCAQVAAALPPTDAYTGCSTIHCPCPALRRDFFERSSRSSALPESAVRHNKWLNQTVSKKNGVLTGSFICTYIYLPARCMAPLAALRSWYFKQGVHVKYTSFALVVDPLLVRKARYVNVCSVTSTIAPSPGPLTALPASIPLSLSTLSGPRLPLPLRSDDSWDHDDHPHLSAEFCNRKMSKWLKKFDLV